MTELMTNPDFLLDWQAAETAAVIHMKTLGFIDAEATGPGTDGGIDAQSSDAAAQVKFYANPIGRPDIQRLRGAAHEYRLPLFYSTGGYTKEAVTYAIEAGVALFLMDPYGRCEPTSDLAALLVQPEYVQERKQRLEDLQAIRYRYAASALESDMKLYAQFAESVSMDPKESALYSHVASGLELVVRAFRGAIESNQFGQADTLFSEIQNRVMFLSFTAPELKQYTDLEDVISEGWLRDATPGSDHLLQRVATGVGDLTMFLTESLNGWSEYLSIRPGDLIDDKTGRFAGMLLMASFDPSLLTPDLLKQLKASLRTGVKKGQLSAVTAFQEIQDRFKSPRGIVARKLRADSIATRILLQLAASDR